MRQQAFASPEEALQHYGVKGMRWGVRKEEDLVGRDSAARDASGKITSKAPQGKPKPVKELSARRQAKVDKFIKKSELMDTRISELKVEGAKLAEAEAKAKGFRKLNIRSEQSLNRDLIASTETARKRAIKDAEATKHGKLTRKQKQVIAGALAVGVLAGTAYALQGQQSGALNSWKLMGRQRLTGAKTPFKENKALSGKMSVDDLLHKIAKPVNPGYSSPGGQMNCRRSTYAYELRRRGFDVHATTSSVGWGQSESGVTNALTTEGKDFFHPFSMSSSVVTTGFSSPATGDNRPKIPGKILLDNLDASKPLGQYTGYISNSKRVLEELAKQPEGARGEVVFKFPSFGHSMAYEIVDGVPHIFDSQKGTLYNAATKMVESKWDGFTAAEIRRLDNLDLDLNFLSRWATNVKR